MIHRNKQALPKWRGLLTPLPSFPGRLHVVNCAASLARLLLGKERSVELWNSAPFHVNLADRIQRQMWLGCYESHVNRASSLLLGAGSVFLDVGANIGYHSYFAAGLVGSTGAVHAFEPDPDLHAVLTRSLSSFPWARPENVAVWDSVASLEFERAFLPEESGWGALTAVRNLRKGQCISVRAVSLDQWHSATNYSCPDVIKLDAEGAEPRVLAGAHAILSKFRPVLLLEANAPLLIQGRSSPSALVAELTRLGYATFILENSQISPFVGIPDYHTVDCICLDEKRAPDFLKKLGLGGFRASLRS
jgi:FkbM family methyltransferase